MPARARRASQRLRTEKRLNQGVNVPVVVRAAHSHLDTTVAVGTNLGPPFGSTAYQVPQPFKPKVFPTPESNPRPSGTVKSSLPLGLPGPSSTFLRYLVAVLPTGGPRKVRQWYRGDCVLLAQHP